MVKEKIYPDVEKARSSYKVGSVIYCGYWRKYDKVLRFTVKDGWNWLVTVAECTKEGIITGKERTHSTAFDKSDFIVS